MNPLNIPHSIVSAHETGEHACVVVLGSESQSELILGLNGVQCLVALLDNDDIGITPLVKRNLTGAVAVLIEHVRDIACGVGGYDRYRLEPDNAGELLEAAEKLARGEAVF